MKIGQKILKEKNETLSGKFTKIGIQTEVKTSDFIEVLIDNVSIQVSPLTHIYELEGVNIETITLNSDKGLIIVDYIGEEAITNG